MKRRIHLTITCLIALLTAFPLQGERPANPFSALEREHIRVRTPGLWGKGRHVFLHLDSLSRREWSFPLPGAQILSPYGIRGGRTHSGVDMKTRAGDTIRCAFRGVVRLSREYGGYGNVVVVRHPGGLETIYSHNARNLVQSGDSVMAGTAIGLVGRTGRATTDHLHFETRIDGEHFNPNILFQLEKGMLRSECIRCTKNKKGIVVKPFNP